MPQKGSFGMGNMFKKLKHCSIIIDYSEIHRSVHLRYFKMWWVSMQKVKAFCSPFMHLSWYTCDVDIILSWRVPYGKKTFTGVHRKDSEFTRVTDKIGEKPSLITKICSRTVSVCTHQQVILQKNRGHWQMQTIFRIRCMSSIRYTFVWRILRLMLDLI